MIIHKDGIDSIYKKEGADRSMSREIKHGIIMKDRWLVL